MHLCITIKQYFGFFAYPKTSKLQSLESRRLPLMNTACPSHPVPSLDAKPATAWLPLVTLAIGFVMAMLDVTVVNVALPSIAVQFVVPLTDLVWIVDGYTLTFAALLLVAGALADRYGAKTVYLAGLAVFTLASLLCGLAPDANTLIAARMLQGLGAALFMPSSLSLLTHAYDDDHVRNRMLAAWSAIVAVAGATGPLLGGVLIHQFGWRGIFLINLPLGVAGLWLARRRIHAAPRRPRALNPISHLLGVIALSSLCFVLIQGNAYGWTSPRITGVTGLCALAIVLLVRRERRHAEPILPRVLFQTPHFAAANAVGFLINLASYGQLFLLSLFLQHARGADALQTGIQLVPMLAVFSIGNLISGRVSARWNVSAALFGGHVAGRHHERLGDRRLHAHDRLLALRHPGCAGQSGRGNRRASDDRHCDAEFGQAPRQQRGGGIERESAVRRIGRGGIDGHHHACAARLERDPARRLRRDRRKLRGGGRAGLASLASRA